MLHGKDLKKNAVGRHLQHVFNIGDYTPYWLVSVLFMCPYILLHSTELPCWLPHFVIGSDDRNPYPHFAHSRLCVSHSTDSEFALPPSPRHVVSGGGQPDFILGRGKWQLTNPEKNNLH